jgi:IS30 family transposase
MAGKHKRTSFLAQAQYWADTVELVHGDLCFKISPPTLASNSYFLLMVDDKSRYMSIVLLPSKDRAPESIQRFQLKAKAETGKRLGGLQIDRGGEFNSTNFLEYYLEHGARWQLMVPYSP